LNSFPVAETCFAHVRLLRVVEDGNEGWLDATANAEERRADPPFGYSVFWEKSHEKSPVS
jgi:hypothetical protein